MPGYVKSLFVLLFFIAIITGAFFLIRWGLKKTMALRIAVIVLSALVLVIITVGLGRYAYPFDIDCKLELLMTVDTGRQLEYIPEGGAENYEQTSAYNTQDVQWWGVYSFDGNTISSYRGFPEEITGKIQNLDLEHYTYIISCEKKIDKLTYNVWEGRGFIPDHHWGKAILSENKDPGKIYVYRMHKNYKYHCVDNVVSTKWW